jgi:hypothetical protein
MGGDVTRILLSIFASIVSSLSVVCFAAVVGNAFKKMKSRWICRKFRASILPESVVFDGRVIRVQINNKTTSRIVIREIYLERHCGWRHRLTHDRAFHAEMKNGMTEECRPDSVLSQAEIDRGFIELPPHTHGCWMSDHADLTKELGQVPKDFARLHVSYHYQNIFGGFEVKDASAPEIGGVANDLVHQHQTE